MMNDREKAELVEWIIKARNYAAAVTRLTDASKRAMLDVEKAEKRLKELGIES